LIRRPQNPESSVISEAVASAGALDEAQRGGSGLQNALQEKRQQRKNISLAKSLRKETSPRMMTAGGRAAKRRTALGLRLFALERQRLARFQQGWAILSSSSALKELAGIRVRTGIVAK